MLARVAERSGHSAAAGVEIDHRGTGDAGEQRACRRQQAHGFLVAVAMKQDPRRSASERQRDPARLPLALDVIFEEDARGCDAARLALRLAAQKRRRVFADR